MEKNTLMEITRQYLLSSKLNAISKEIALDSELISTKIFEEPILAIAEAGSPEFDTLKLEHVIGEHFMAPQEWLPKAKSVISFFFPFTETIRNSNKVNMHYPSNGWLHGRVEGQVFLDSFSGFISEYLNERDFETVSPSIDERFRSNTDKDNMEIHKLYTSNWSERHIAYVCGLGTFGLSKGIITEKGMAGRLTSIITELPVLPDKKEKKYYNEDCTMCGACIKNCPVNAISFKQGKNQEACSKFIELTLSENKPRYGCGKCQIDVPCESRNPRNSR